jgi:hypothetical protein
MITNSSHDEDSQSLIYKKFKRQQIWNSEEVCEDLKHSFSTYSLSHVGWLTCQIDQSNWIIL